MIKKLITAGVEQCCNRYFVLDDEIDRAIKLLAPAKVCLQITDLSISYTIVIHSDRYQLLSQRTEDADATIAMTANYCVNQWVGSKTPVSKELSMTGDLKLATKFAALLQRHQVPWGNLLASCIGDTATEVMTTTFNQVCGQVKSGRKYWIDQLLQYIQLEIGLLPQQAAFTDFSQRIRQLQYQVDALC